jgi:hypothetical protein
MKRFRSKTYETASFTITKTGKYEGEEAEISFLIIW